MAKKGKGKKYFTFLQSYYYVIVLEGLGRKEGGDPVNEIHRNGVLSQENNSLQFKQNLQKKEELIERKGSNIKYASAFVYVYIYK